MTNPSKRKRWKNWEKGPDEGTAYYSDGAHRSLWRLNDKCAEQYNKGVWELQIKYRIFMDDLATAIKTFWTPVVVPTEMSNRFEVGKHYFYNSFVDDVEMPTVFKVASRSPQTLHLEGNFGHRRPPIRRFKIHRFEDTEYIKMGDWSYAPMITATNVATEEMTK